MRELERDGKKYRLPSSLSRFQREFYIHLIDWKWEHITTEPGTNRGEHYDAILPDNIAEQRLHIYPNIRQTLEAHQEQFPFRSHLHFNHMASSQAANINLFLPILRHTQAAAILRMIKPDLARLATDHLDNGYRIEFWDEGHGTLNDNSGTTGTDTDLGIAYYNHEGVLCLWLIEHKLTEAEFTTCGGYNSRGKKPRHDCGKSFAELVANPTPCYYHDANDYNYWRITAANQNFFPNHAQHQECPFRRGMNQLWRNQLLGLAIEQDDQQPYQQSAFSVVHHPLNNALDRTITSYKHLIANNPKFTTFTSADVVTAAEQYADEELRDWLNWYKELYNII